MITLIEYTEGYEPMWDVWSGDKYLGEIDLNTFDGFIAGLNDEFEIVRAS